MNCDQSINIGHLHERKRQFLEQFEIWLRLMILLLDVSICCGLFNATDWGLKMESPFSCCNAQQRRSVISRKLFECNLLSCSSLYNELMF